MCVCSVVSLSYKEVLYKEFTARDKEVEVFACVCVCVCVCGRDEGGGGLLGVKNNLG